MPSSDPADRELVRQTVQQILSVHGEDLDIVHIPEVHRNILLVQQAHALVGNGGFQRLFSHPIPGDSTYRLTGDAHAAIGATEGHRAFRKALAGFLWIKPTAFVARPFNRLRLPLSIAKALLGFETADTLYWEASPETYARLASYIRENNSEIPDGPIRKA